MRTCPMHTFKNCAPGNQNVHAMYRVYHIFRNKEIFYVSHSDAILPTFSGFPDFSSVQCEKNEIRFSLF